jgi:hypothetical protein
MKMNNYMLITYWNTLYNQTFTFRTNFQVTFENDGIHFSAGGHRYTLAYENVIKIEPLEN